MQLENLFLKPVDRPIEGVIKADDDVSLYLELDEYVITNEVSKRLDSFLDVYLNYQGANGVWVSGFFGSGKSHLLKMLALLLENKKIEDVSPLDVFLKKHPLNEGGIFANDLKRAVAIPSKSILFNIDQKADVISKIELDALIAVFVKVFDEHCGYYGKQGYIAKFERELDEDGQLEPFKKVFLAESGMEWGKGRARAKRTANAIDNAYNQVSSQSVVGILDKYRQDYRLSIEDFADQIKNYIDKKESDFRRNFFIDEVGQYIANNIKLMTNLQTFAESLATKCNGQAWVIVTAQEDMSSVIGEGGKQQGNDFTKIQARFKNRMKLTSQNVAEVIQLRLLEKREEYIEPLSDLFHNLDYVDGNEHQRLSVALVDPKIYKGSAIQKLKSDIELLDQKLEEQVKEEKLQAINVIDALENKFIGFDEYKKLDADKQGQLSRVFSEVKTKINAQTLIAMVRDESHRFEEHSYPSLIQRMDTWNQLVPNSKTAPSPSDTQSYKGMDDATIEESLQINEPPPAQTISIKHLKIGYQKPWISSYTDADEYLDRLKRETIKRN